MYIQCCHRKIIKLGIQRPGLDTFSLTSAIPLLFLGFSFLICKVKLITLTYLKGGCENLMS